MTFKIIKDNAPSVATEKGELCNYAIAQNSELFLDLLKLLLVEHTNDFLNTGSLDKLVEIQLVIDAFKSQVSDSFEQFYQTKSANNETYLNKYIGFFPSFSTEEEPLTTDESNKGV